MKTATKLFLIITTTTLVSLCLGKIQPARALFNDRLSEKLEFSVEQSNNSANTITVDYEEYSINQRFNFELNSNSIIINFLFLNFSILVTLFMLEILLILEEEFSDSINN